MTQSRFSRWAQRTLCYLGAGIRERAQLTLGSRRVLQDLVFAGGRGRERAQFGSVVAEEVREQPDAADAHSRCNLHLLLQLPQEGMRHKDVTWFQIARCIGRVRIVFRVHEDRASAGQLVGVSGLLKLIRAGLKQGVAHQMIVEASPRFREGYQEELIVARGTDAERSASVDLTLYLLCPLLVKLELLERELIPTAMC